MSLVGKVMLILMLALLVVLRVAQSAPAPQFGPGGARGTGPAGNPSEIAIGSPALGVLGDCHHLNEQICAALSIALNTWLSYLLLREKNEVLRAYSRVLLLKCSFDVAYTFVCICVEVQVEVAAGQWIYVVNGFVKNFSWHRLAVGLYVCTTIMTLLVDIVQFIFRYMLVCRNYQLRVYQLLGLGLVALTCGAWSGFIATKSFLATTDTRLTHARLLADPMWLDELGNPPVFLVAEKNDVFTLASLITSALYNVACWIVVPTLGAATLRSLKRADVLMSERTRKMQTQLTRIFFTQALAALIIVTVPAYGLGIALIFDINIPGWGLAMGMIFAWIPTVNPFITLCMVTSYRKATVQAFRRLFSGLHCKAMSTNQRQ